MNYKPEWVSAYVPVGEISPIPKYMEVSAIFNSGKKQRCLFIARLNHIQTQDFGKPGYKNHRDKGFVYSFLFLDDYGNLSSPKNDKDFYDFEVLISINEDENLVVKEVKK